MKIKITATTLVALCGNTLSFSAFPATVTAAEATPYNVVFFVVDDMGWMDGGAYGSEYYETQHFDALAAKGIRFTQAYAQPMCSPTRASLMSGQAVARHGITSPAGHLPPQKEVPQPPVSRNFMCADQFTLAEALRDAGYATGHVGKWHLGISPEHQPSAQGFGTVFSAEPSAGPPGNQPGRFRYFSPYGVIPMANLPTAAESVTSPMGRTVNTSPTG